MKRVPLILALLALLALRLDATPPRNLISGEFRLTDAVSGRTVERHGYDGRWRLVFFGFTHCGLVCPLGMRKLAAVLHGLGDDADALAPLFVTLDPERDTAAVLKEYTAAFDPRIRPLRGDRAATVAAMKGFRLEAERIDTGGGNYQFEHPAVIYLMDQDGAFLELFSTNTPAEELVRRVRAAMHGN